VNSRLPKWMVWPGSRPTPVELSPLAMKESFSEGPSDRLEEKHAANPPSWRAYCRCFLHWQDTRHTIVYPGSGPYFKVILKMNSGYNGVSREPEKFIK
jgi:hypothetical protein